LLTARKGISGLGRGPNVGAHGGATIRWLLHQGGGLLKDNRLREKEWLSEEERLPEEERLVDRDRLWDERLTQQDQLLRGAAGLAPVHPCLRRGEPLRDTYYCASARNPSKARDRPDGPRPEFDVRHPDAFVFASLLRGGLLLGAANGDFLPFGDLLLFAPALRDRGGAPANSRR